jgi:tryptophanyl-tRNA synthetase
LPAEAREGRPEAYNLLGIYAALSGESLAAVLGQFEGQGFADFKRALIDLAVAELGPIGDEMKRLTAAPDMVDAILQNGVERARAIADPILREVKDIVGFLQT